MHFHFILQFWWKIRQFVFLGCFCFCFFNQTAVIHCDQQYLSPSSLHPWIIHFLLFVIVKGWNYYLSPAPQVIMAHDYIIHLSLILTHSLTLSHTHTHTHNHPLTHTNTEHIHRALFLLVVVVVFFCLHFKQQRKYVWNPQVTNYYTEGIYKTTRKKKMKKKIYTKTYEEFNYNYKYENL